MFLLFLKMLLTKPSAQSFFETISFHAWVKPWDIDANMHLTNSRYLLYMDKGRVACFFEVGFLRKLLRVQCETVVKQDWCTLLTQSLTSFQVD